MTKVEVDIDLRRLEQRFSPEKLRAKQAAFASRVAFEMRAYVPEDQGHLRGTEPLASDYEEGRITWNAPYARYVHDLPASSISKTAPTSKPKGTSKVSGTSKSNPKATSRWPEAAKAERGEAWRRFAEGLLRRD